MNPASVQGPGRATGSTRLLLDYLNGRLKAIVDSTISLVDIADCTEGHLLAGARGEPGKYVLSGATLTVREGVLLLGRLTGINEPVRACRPPSRLRRPSRPRRWPGCAGRPARLPRPGPDRAARPHL